MGKALLQCPKCDGTDDFVLVNGQLACMCSVEKATDVPAFVEDPPRNYVLLVGPDDSTYGLGTPFKG